MAGNREIRDARHGRGNRERNVYKKETLRTAAREGQTIPKSKQQAISKAKPFGWKLTNFKQFWYSFLRKKIGGIGDTPTPPFTESYPRSRNH